MSHVAVRIEPRVLAVALLSAALAFAVGVSVGHAPLPVPFLLVGGVTVAAVAFLRTELAIHLLILSMLLSPEFVVTGALGSGSLDAERSATLRIEDLLLVVIGTAWLAKMAVHKQLGPVLRTPLNAPIAGYAGIVVISTVVGMASGRVQPALGTLYVAKYLEYFVIYFLVVNHTRDRRALQRMLITAAVTAALVAVVALLQIPGGERVTAPFEGERGEPNTLGGYLVLMMAVVGGIALEVRRPRVRLALVSLVGVMGVSLLYTLSRSSWIAAGAAAVALMVATRERRRLAAALVVACVVLIAFAPAPVSERIGDTFTERRTSVHVGSVALDASASDRIRSWGTALEAFTERPLLGYGVTGYHFIDAQYLRVLVENGLLGFLAFGFLVLSLSHHALRASRELESPLLRGLTAGFLAALVGLLVHAVGANTFVIVRIMEPFWLFAGLVVAAPRVEKARAFG